MKAFLLILVIVYSKFTQGCQFPNGEIENKSTKYRDTIQFVQGADDRRLMQIIVPANLEGLDIEGVVVQKGVDGNFQYNYSLKFRIIDDEAISFLQVATEEAEDIKVSIYYDTCGFYLEYPVVYESRR